MVASDGSPADKGAAIETAPSRADHHRQRPSWTGRHSRLDGLPSNVTGDLRSV